MVLEVENIFRAIAVEIPKVQTVGGGGLCVTPLL